MQEQTLQTTDLGGRTADFSVWGMFSQADILVQFVMLFLIGLSIWSWAIFFATWLRLRRTNTEADEFEDTFWSGNSLDDLFDTLKNRASHPMAMIFVGAMREWRRSMGAGQGAGRMGGVQERLAKVMRVTIQREMERLEGHTGYLATIGSSAPFIGLFGTVWGIMNSFQSIALTSNTSLAVVAPGIAEALLATALGLVAAIPAVVAYNKLSTDLARYAGRLDGFADEFSAILSRQLDERAA